MSPYLLDGGFGSQLKTHVSENIDGHPLWGTQFLLTNKEYVIDTHRDFIRAGADIISTNSYQSSVCGIKAHLGLTIEESCELIKKSVVYAREAINIEKEKKTVDQDKQILVAGSVGPFGASLCDGSEYRGDYVDKFDITDIERWHRIKMKLLIEGGIDILAFETIPSLKEAEVLVKLLKEFPDQRAWLSFSCKDEVYTSGGDEFVTSAVRCFSMNPSQLVAVGINCISPRIATALVSSLKEKNIPLILYPNTGEIWDPIKKIWIGYNEPVDMYVRKWLDLGVKYLGGCCGTYATDIAIFRNVIDEWGQNRTK